MLRLSRWLVQACEFLITRPVRAVRMLLSAFAFSPKLFWLRLIAAPFVFYVVFAFVLTYIYAPIRGFTGQYWMGKTLTYANERSLATALYDVKGKFVGIFDPVLDSEEDFNYTGKTIVMPHYVAYPDHKSLHVAHVPPDYWSCLAYQEDRHLGGLINPFGIDFFGVLKIPFSTIDRTIRAGHIDFGVGGSTLAMQLARIFFKNPPRPSETAAQKLSRKFDEWWIAPVIQWRLTRGGTDDALKRWAADHFPLAQRTGGRDLFGVAQTSLIVFGKPASELTTAEQYVLAAAVNWPIILLANSKHMDALQKDNWDMLTLGRASVCARALIHNPARRHKVLAELKRLSETPPNPRLVPWHDSELAVLPPKKARRADVNPVYRSNTMLPAVKYGVREQLTNRFGFDWRKHVRAVHLTLDAAGNLDFRHAEERTLATLEARFRGQINPAYTLSMHKPSATAASASTPKTTGGTRQAGQAKDASAKSAVATGPRRPEIIIAAADLNGHLVRYFASNFTASYFGSPTARNPKTGHYDPAKETRAIASIGKIVAGIAIANQGPDTGQRQWLDTHAPASGLETCKQGNLRRMRSARVAFACSLNRPVEWRAAQVPLGSLKATAQKLGITLTEPVTSAANLAKSLVVGHVAASPRRVQRMAAVVLASLTGHGHEPVPLPTLEDKLDLNGKHPAAGSPHKRIVGLAHVAHQPAPQISHIGAQRPGATLVKVAAVPGKIPRKKAVDPDPPADPLALIPDQIIKPDARAALKSFLTAPVCYPYGTLSQLSDWCAGTHKDVALLFAKTGTRGTGAADPHAYDTVDLWTTGGIKFKNGAAYSFVVLVGTGSPSHPWARDLYAGEVTAPLLRTLFEDLEKRPAPTPEQMSEEHPHPPVR